PQPLGDRKLSALGQGRDLPGRQIAGQDGKRAPGDGLAEEPGHQSPALGRPRQHSSGQPSPPPRPAAHSKSASGCMNATLPCPWVTTLQVTVNDDTPEPGVQSTQQLHEGPVLTAAFLSQGLVATGGTDRSLVICQWDNGQLRAPHS